MLYGNLSNNEFGNEIQEEKRKDLSNAYSNMIRDESSRISGQQIHQMASQTPQSVPQLPPQVPPQIPQIIEQTPQQIQHQIQHQMPQQESQYSKRRMQQYEYSFWDRMSLKRPEVVKLAIFSLVIVFAIALDRIGTHYITKYINDNIFTDTQEFFIRLSYPIIVFLLLWIAKSM